MWGAKRVPRTNILTNVTTEDPVIHFILKLLWNRIFQFNCKITNTLAAIHHIRLRNGIGRTGVNTAGTSAAIIFNRTIIFEFKVQNQLRYKKEGTLLFVYQI